MHCCQLERVHNNNITKGPGFDVVIHIWMAVGMLSSQLCRFPTETIYDNPWHKIYIGVFFTLHCILLLHLRSIWQPTCLAATKQLYEWFSPSVRPSVTPFWLCSHHRIITKFSGFIANERSDVHAKGQRSRSQRSWPNLPGFRTVSPVRIYIYMMMEWCIKLDAA